MHDSSLTLRVAVPNDAPALLKLVVALAEYERLPAHFAFDETQIRRRLFEPGHSAHALIAEVNGEAVGFCLYYFMQTFFDVRWMVIEATYVAPAQQRHGVGRAMLQRLAKQAVAERCVRVEWSVLEWNREAIAFYESIGATPHQGWRIYRLEGEILTQMSQAAR